MYTLNDSVSDGLVQRRPSYRLLIVPQQQQQRHQCIDLLVQRWLLRLRIGLEPDVHRYASVRGPGAPLLCLWTQF